MSTDALFMRTQLNNEWHARPTAQMASPFRCSHQVFQRQGPSSHARENFARLCQSHGQASPVDGSRHHQTTLGSALVKWEGHTDADSVTCLVPGNAAPLFSEPAFGLAPKPLRSLFGEKLFCGIKVEVLKQTVGDMDMAVIRGSLGADNLYGGPVADGKASLWSSFLLDAEGFSRIVIVDHELPPGAIGRLLQRVIEADSYRMQAMSALPLARETMANLSALEAELEPLMESLAADRDTVDHDAMLNRLSMMAAQTEHLAAATSYRFGAAKAYSSIVEQRLEELREELVLTQPRYSVFLLRSLQPAMRTCLAAERRIDQLAQRVSRATSLLNSMVGVRQTQQTNRMIESMSRNAEMQVRLQEAVEGFSIFVISYYSLGLINYMLTAAKALGSPLDPKITTGIMTPLVLVSVWVFVHWVRRRITQKSD
ncbi:conserved hypothetical protein [Luminiphilus syltensis NOR5-1B]|uniref:DUF3422 domain-containing protein n=1 Tax=Luminiphilus syltensis NOR5-1B TaxID=565045 RepID=B8KSW5_9GAMM|nr:conserved hypothetical protein [Luminiphilus syltensis NOR5-1B]